MTDYFDELNCEPIDPQNTDSHQMLLFARFMMQNGYADLTMNQQDLPPPASKELVENLKERIVTPEDEKCSICLKPNEQGEQTVFKILPCKHEFHDSCILPWLNKTNTCPLCRYEMKTDDEAYEANKRFEARARQRDQDIEDLHNSMYN